MRALRPRRLLGWGFLLVGLMTMGSGIGLSRFLRLVDRPILLAEPVELTIPAGTHLGEAAEILVAAGLVRSARPFVLLARMEGLTARIRAGTYRFENSASPRQVLEHLVSGRERLYRVTLPEGFRVREMIQRIAGEGFGTEEELLLAVRSPELLSSLDFPTDGPEGYLFPDTYLFRRETTPAEVVGTMVERFRQVWSEELAVAPIPPELEPGEVVVLASIVEKETGDPSERPLIASVFANRLARGMRLQSDPTVIYGLEEFDGNLTRKHLTTDGPYNTYTRSGLPHGPICCPGRMAIRAVLNPPATDLLYFVARGDGTHQFSRTLTEHNRAVRRYQLGG